MHDDGLQSGLRRTRHYLLLDGLRGLAAVFVAIYHLYWFTGIHLAVGSYLAVDFFFALSGFVIAHAYSDRVSSSMSMQDYLERRMIRLYPLYAAGLFLGVGHALVASLTHHEGPVALGRIAAKAILNALYLPIVGGKALNYSRLTARLGH